MPIDALVLLHLPSRHATAMIPPRSNRKTPIEYDREAYKRRNLIEMCQPSQAVSPYCNALRKNCESQPFNAMHRLDRNLQHGLTFTKLKRR